MKALKTIANCCLVFITVIAVCVIIAFVYYHYFVHDITVGTNYINNQIGLDIKKADELTDEEFAVWMKYHFSTCEREELQGYSNHLLYICRKV